MKKYTTHINNHLSIVILLTILMSPLALTVAQDNYSNRLSISNISIQKETEAINISMDIDLAKLNINKNELIIITPVVESNEPGKSIELEPYAVLGKKRNKVLNRPFTWSGKTELTIPQDNKILYKRGHNQLIHYTATIPYDEWQRDAQLVLKTEVIGCADCFDSEPNRHLSAFLGPKYIPDYRFSYIEPAVEEIKQRSETYSAYLNYMVGKWDLLLHYKNNEAELKKVEEIIMQLNNDSDLTITDFTITGYASPEGSSQSNLLLSQRRAESFATFIEGKYDYDPNQFTVKWVGEDWDGLRTAVATSNLANKNQIIEIIENVADFDARDERIIALDNGATYRRLLNDFYPPLRRNDYSISFVSRPFNVKEAAEVINTRPKLLSLNEMYLVAGSFKDEGKEFNHIFEIAAQTFPDDATANINVAVQDLQNNKTDEVINRLEQFADNPQALNLLGLAYAKKEMYSKAQEYLNQAIAKGSKDAIHNIQQLKRVMEDN